MAGQFANSTAAIDNILTQEANRIGDDIHKATMHTSPWMDLIRQSAFPEGMGYELNTLIYDRALPLKAGTLAVGAELGVNWNDLQTNAATSEVGFTAGQTLKSQALSAEGKATIDFTKKLKSYSLKKAVVESPRINVEDLRYAAHRNDQLSAIMDLMQESVRHTWENRYRDEYDRLADNTVLCKSTTSTFISGVETLNSFRLGSSTDSTLVSTTQGLGTADPTDIDDGNDGQADLTGNISNAVLDKIYFQLVRAGAGAKAYGRENGRPIFSVVLSSEASRFLQTEDEKIRDDIRYNNAKVGELVAPLGVERSFRGFYHLIDDLTTRYTDAGNVLARVEPFTVSGGVVVPNTAYESAPYEAAYVLVDDVMESLIPAPTATAPGLTFDPVNFKGEFRWTNIADAEINPDKTIGFFRGIMANASKPIKTQFGYVVIFKRNTDTAAK